MHFFKTYDKIKKKNSGDIMRNIVPLIDEKNFSQMMQYEVEPFLAQIRTEGYFNSQDGKQLHYEAHTVNNARGNVVICHGFTEFGEKFREMAYYFVKNGFNAFALDHRGHGKSYRVSGKPETVGIGKFDDYINDLDVFVREIVTPMNENKPMYIYAHSMGGAVAARYLQEHPEVFEKAVLTAPMICAEPGVSVPVAKAATSIVASIGFKNISVPGKCKFNPNAKFETSSDTSRARFDYYMDIKRNEPAYRTSGPTFGWLSESLKVTDKLLDDTLCKKISAKVIIFQPENDNRVISSYQNKFVEKVSDAGIVFVPHSKHEIFAATNDVLKGYLDKIFEFLF